MQENFRTQAFGFNKKDVMDYIFNLATEKENNEKELNESIEALTGERDSLAGENESLKTKVQEQSEQLNALRAELADLKIQNSRLYEENQESRRLILDNEREFNIKNEQISKLTAENEEYAKKIAEYSEIAEDVGRTIMNAKHMAEEIVNEAKGEAEEIRRKTAEAANKSACEIGAVCDRLAFLKNEAAALISNCESVLGGVEANLKSVAEDISGISDPKDSDENDAPSEQNPSQFF